jgi:sugar phosphate permease
MADVQQARTVLRYRWLVFGIMALAYIFVYFHRLCPAVVAEDLQKEFQASASLIGLLASAYFYPYALMQFPAGLLSDSLGPRTTATVFLLLAGVGSILFGMSPSAEYAVGARVLVGLGVAMVFIPTMKVNSQWFRVSEFALMAAILNTVGGFGAWTAATPLAYVTGMAGWRAAFYIIGAGTLVVAVLIWLFVRNRPQDMGLPSLAEIDHRGPGTAAAPQQIPLWEGARQVVSQKFFWPIALWFFFGCGVFFGFGGLWAGPYLEQAYGLSKAEAGGILSMIALGMIVGSPALSLLSDRVLHSRKKVMMLASGGLTLVFLFMCFFPVGLPKWSLYLLIFLFCVGSSAIVVIGFTTTKELFPVEIAGTSVGTVNLFPFLGGAIFQVVLGVVLDIYGRNEAGIYPQEAYHALLFVLLGASIAAFLCTLVMKETFPLEARITPK